MTDGDDQKPRIRLAVKNHERDINRHRAEVDLQWPLKELAANLIRVVRGAGKPYELGRQCADVVKAYHDYRDRVGEWPSSYSVGEILSIRHRENRAATDRAMEWEDAVQQMIAGGLQAAASQLLGQLTQERAGEREIFDGLRIIERQREENRAAMMKKPVKRTPKKPSRKR
ncbi:hypothetical protein [Shinella sp. HZN7]|uniref:hypothetical protein n=1 Tax=Shinella sp. (strain HZN7) TaxID=879274 RepID=UPI0011AB51F6|nr:hypothetical protein [Shinella sp. HZN7]